MEEAPDEVGVGAADEDLDPAAFLPHFDDETADAVARGEVFTADAVVTAEIGFDTPQIHHEGLSLEALDLTVHELADTCFVLLVKDVALSLTDTLEKALLHGLGDDPPELVEV